MTFEPFEREHFAQVDVQPAQRPYVEASDAAALDYAAGHGPAWTVRDDDGAVIGCSGLIPHENDEWLAWAIFSERIKGHGRALVRFARAVFDEWPAPVSMYVAPEHAEAARFARALGFQFERVENGLAFSGLHYYRRER